MPMSASHLSVKGVWEVKRRFKIPAMTHERDAQVVNGAVQRLPGVCNVQVDIAKGRAVVVYDITRQDYNGILTALAQAGFPIADTRWNRIKTRWLQSLDETGCDNANAPAPVCCSNPRGIAPTKRH